MLGHGQPTEIIDAGIDYLSVSCSHRCEDAEAFWAQCAQFMTISCAEGATIRDAKLNRYEGYRNEFFFAGRNENGYYAQCSSAPAHAFAEKLIESGVEVHPTRIDSQATVCYADEYEWLGKRLREAIRAAEEATQRGKKSAIAVFESGRRDTGLTVGRRGGERYFRAYHARSGGHDEFPESAIRFEVEHRGSLARQAWEMYRVQQAAPSLSKILVQGEMVRLGANEPWFAAQEVPHMKPSYVPTCNKRRFEYVLTTAIPCIRRLLEDERYADELRDALAKVLAETEGK